MIKGWCILKKVLFKEHKFEKLINKQTRKAYKCEENMRSHASTSASYFKNIKLVYFQSKLLTVHSTTTTKTTTK